MIKATNLEVVANRLAEWSGTPKDDRKTSPTSTTSTNLEVVANRLAEWSGTPKDDRKTSPKVV